MICCLRTEVDYVLSADPEAPSRACCHGNHLNAVMSSTGHSCPRPDSGTQPHQARLDPDATVSLSAHKTGRLVISSAR
jgi:hypothetical protein